MSLKDVDPKHMFVTKDGLMLTNLFELSLELSDMSDETFMHHVNDAKNDFYSWVHHVVDDKKLAQQLAKIRDKNEMMRAVQNRILELQREDADIGIGMQDSFLGSKHLLAGLFIVMVVGLILLRALVF
jgi:hypothetical protein